MRNKKCVLVAATLPVFLALQAFAGDKIRNATAGNLNTDAVWGTGTAGSAPGAGDRAVWNSTSTGATSGTLEALGGPVTWGGIMLSGAFPTTPGVTINGTDTLGLGSFGISLNDGVTTNRRVTLGVPVNLLADQTWQLGDTSQQAGIQANGVVSGAAKLTISPSPLATKLGIATFVNAANTFSGGLVISPGAIVATGTTTTSTYSAVGGTLTGSCFGTGPLTINGGTLNIVSTTKALYNPAINIGGDFTLFASSRLDVGGAIDLGNDTRTISLAKGLTVASFIIGGGNHSVRMQPMTGGIAMNTISNGSLRYTASSAVAAGSFTTVQFSGVNGNSFVNNSGLVLGDRVVTAFATSFGWGSGGADAPAVTVEATGYLNLSDTTASRSVQVFSLAGSGTVINLATAAGTAQLNINGRTKTSSSEFSGVIRNTDTTAFPGVNASAVMGLNKTGDTTQILSGASTYTGSTTIAGGVLSVNTLANGGTTSAIGAASSSAGNLALSGGTLRYTGAAASTDKLFTVRATGGTLEASGTGAVNFTNTGAIVSDDPAARNLTFSAGVSTLSVGADDLAVGMTVSGAGISPGTTISALDRYAGIATLSLATSAAGTSTPISFSTIDRTLALTGANTDANTLAGSLSNSAGGAALGIAKSGAGKWVLSGNNTYTGATKIDSGTLVLQGGAATPVTTNAGGAIVNGGLLVINYSGTSPKAAIVDDPSAGLTTNSAGGFQTGRVRTTNAVDAAKAIGWLDDGTSTFQVKYTYKGDADLTGTVTSIDFNALAGKYGTTVGAVWADGDFNYDGKVNTLDFNLLAGNFGAPALGSPVGAAGLGSVVPEPASLSLLALGAAGLMRRRRD